MDLPLQGLQDQNLLQKAAEFIQALAASRNSQLISQATQDDERIRRVSLTATDLGTERLYQNAQPVPFKFSSLKVESASGSDVRVRLKLGKNIAGRDFLTLTQNEVYNFGTMVEGWLFWDAQSNETMELVFAIGIDFTSGSFISEQAGGVTISEGSNLSELTSVEVDDTVGGVEVVAANALRTRVIIQNPATDAAGAPTGNASVVVGASGLTVADGVLLMPGGELEYKGSAAVYAICAAGLSADIRILEMEI